MNSRKLSGSAIDLTENNTESNSETAATNRVAGLLELTRSESAHGPAWIAGGEDLNVNLLVFHAGERVLEHVNTEVDVLMVAISGKGVLTIDGQSQALSAGDTVVVSKGSRRGVKAESERFAYLTCHRRRGGLTPRLEKRSG